MLPAFLLGPVAGLALKFPGVAHAALTAGKFIKVHWKPIAIGTAIVGAVAGGYFYVQHVKHEAYASGFTAAENQAKAQVAEANKRAAYDTSQLKLLQQRYADLSVQRQQQVKIVTQTKIERIEREVQGNPVYRQCSLTDGVFHDLKDLATAVNASISASEH